MSSSRESGSAVPENQPEIVHPADADEVAAAVRRAVEEGRPVIVRGGGHGFWKPAPGALTIDVRALASIEVGEETERGRLVRVGTGALWGEVAAALAPHGVAISSGDTASVGVGGLAVGGGIGLLVRDRGLAVDQLRGAQVVTADGRVVEASAAENAELFWAIRGGGGNFGIVTRLDFEAAPLAGVLAGELTVDGDQAALLRVVRDTLATAPRELTVTYMDVPAMDPSAPAGARLAVVWAGTDEAALEPVLQPITAVEGVGGEVARTAYADALSTMPHDVDDPVPPMLSVNGLFAELDDALIDRLVAFRRAHAGSVVFLRSLGGAYGDVADDATAFPARAATWFVMAVAFDFPGMLDDRERETARTELEAIAQGRLAAYTNFADPASNPDPAVFYAPQVWSRLRALKAQWDPRNLFSGNHNIPPAG
ncbi:FAD-linked oxidoreductase [Microbacterium sp. 8M]|uniref:FAD-binding oxidoreductase n=1 Tax=Microbacterium sp. 8M TaxID=2653153 RepID=UPI0012F321E0|nr:FAD-binding protein [Microbacterium sp. 8M]VXB15667.1 FAD-linked oxidoreductase [Microbacterium sp. 8M]